jgi:hypothetical protein
MFWRIWVKVTLVIGVVYFTINSLEAKQLSFKKSIKDGQMDFAYQWSDHREQARDIAFSLPLLQLNKQTHKKFVASLAQQYVYIELHKAARKIDPKEANVKIQHRGQDIQIKVTSRSQDQLDKWQKSMAQSQETATNQYLNDHYFNYFYSPLGQKAVKPDHIRYISENQQALLPISQAVYDILATDSETRAYVNLLLSWVQSIPYNTLDNRLDSNGAGYVPPLSVVANNQGDCDSKSALMASLIRSLLPKAKMVMIYLPEHALLGISLPFRTTENTLDIEGTDYLLMEPTGPAMMPLGTVASSSEGYISSQMFSHEVIP